jgi:hypothetical protein
VRMMDGGATLRSSQPGYFEQERTRDGAGSRFGIAIVFVLLATTARGLSALLIGGVVPLPDALLILFILVRRRQIVGALRSSASLHLVAWLWGIWLLFSALRFVHDFGIYGQDAARDWIMVPEFAAIFLGASLAVSREAARLTERGLLRCVDFIAAFSPVYLFRDTLAGPGTRLADFFQFGNISVAGAALLIAGAAHRGKRGAFWMLSGSLALAVSQTRMSYLVVPMVLITLWLFSRSGKKHASIGVQHRISVALPLAVVILGFAALSLVPQVDGRLGSVGISSIKVQLASVFNGGDGAQSSVEDRRQWWTRIKQDMDSDPSNYIYGMGYGPDLIGGFRSADGELVRKPHNDYIETSARSGVITAICLIGILLIGLSAAFKSALRGGPAAVFIFSWLAAGAAQSFAQPYWAYAHGSLLTASMVGYAVVRKRYIEE